MLPKEGIAMLKAQTRSSSVKTWAVMGCLALILVVPGWAAAQAFDRIVVFGTSLSDPGNAFALRGGTSTPPDYGLDPFFIPDAPYTGGGGSSHHFSNGPTWIEQFARPVGLTGSVRPAFKGSNAKATNYAVGGARAHEDGINFNLSAQVEAFRRDFGGVAPSNALYVIEMGGNDIRDALVRILVSGDPHAGDVIIAGALGSIGATIQELFTRGARKFLVWNAPNIGLTPAIGSLGGLPVFIAGQVTEGFNSQLEAAVLVPLGGALPGIEIVRLNVYQKLNDIVANPGAFDLTEVHAACVTPNVPPFDCKNADEYLFWDGIHPTNAAHGIIAQEAAHVLPH